MIKPRAQLNPEEAAEFERLSEDYSVATGHLRKTLRVGNPPEIGEVQLFLEAELQVASIIRRLKELIGVAE